MQHTHDALPPPTPFIMQTDILQYITNVEPPADDVFRSFQNFRMVSRAARHAVDRQLANVRWNADLLTRGREFCDDLAPGTVLPEGATHSAGVHRLLENGSYGEIATAINTFVRDPVTLCKIFAPLQEQLSVPEHPTFPFDVHAQHFMQCRVAAAITTPDNKLIRAIIRSIRFHIANITVVKPACAIVVFLRRCVTLGEPSVPNVVCVYITETMLSVIQEHAQNDSYAHTRLLEFCLFTIRTVTRKYFPQTINGQFMLNVMAQIVWTHPRDVLVLEHAVCLMRDVLATMPYGRQSTRLLIETSDVPHMEDMIIKTLEKCTHKDSRLLLESIGVLCHFHLLSRESTRQTVRTLELIMIFLMGRALQVDLPPRCDSIDALNAIVTCLMHIIPSYWEQPPPAGSDSYPATARTTFSGDSFMPILVYAVRRLPHGPRSKSVCTRLFMFLSFLCQNHAEHTNWVVTHNVLDILNKKYSTTTNTTNIDPDWDRKLARLQRLLRANSH